MHAAVDSDTYNGYYIPKGVRISQLLEFILIRSTGTTVTPNVWYG